MTRMRGTTVLGLLALLASASACQPANTRHQEMPDFATLIEVGDPAVVNVRAAGRTRGSGFLVHDSGLVLTAWHVVDGMRELGVRRGNTDLSARLVAYDARADLALLSITPPADWRVLGLEGARDARLGEWLMVLGNPFGTGMTASAGIVGAVGRTLADGGMDGWLQTDASINPGNSGGPVVAADGSLIGVATAKLAAGDGVGFVLPASAAQALLQKQLCGADPCE